MTPLQLYKKLIDGLVGGRQGVLGLWIRERGWPDLPENQKKNNLLAQLTPEQREVVADIAAQARDGGIHDTLAYLQDEICRQEFRLVQHGLELPVDPFDTQLYYDWVARCDGEEWPDERHPTRPSENA
jgi:hypothetical protein